MNLENYETQQGHKFTGLKEADPRLGPYVAEVIARRPKIFEDMWWDFYKHAYADSRMGKHNYPGDVRNISTANIDEGGINYLPFSEDAIRKNWQQTVSNFPKHTKYYSFSGSSPMIVNGEKIELGGLASYGKRTVGPSIDSRDYIPETTYPLMAKSYGYIDPDTVFYDANPYTSVQTLFHELGHMTGAKHLPHSREGKTGQSAWDLWEDRIFQELTPGEIDTLSMYMGVPYQNIQRIIDRKNYRYRRMLDEGLIDPNLGQLTQEGEPFQK
tara:strand:+ start:525 stop:1334 length:810 start_codon:yes stop_codon:yes gene_type:complete